MLTKPAVPCNSCTLRGNGCGFVPAAGTGKNGVLVVLDHPDADDAEAGLPTIGKSGFYLWNVAKKIGLDREDFRIHNILSCRPPSGRLLDEPYEDLAIATCAPNLAATIAEHKRSCHERGLSPTILALGPIAFRTLLGLRRHDATLKEDYHAYVHEGPAGTPAAGCWVVPSFHPLTLQRGQHQYVPTLQFAFQRAVEIAREGFAYHTPDYTLDPPAGVFSAWVDAYRARLARDPIGTFLSFDIETPMKAKKGEDKLFREDDDDYIILRCAFAYEANRAISIPWTAAYMAALERLFGDQGNQFVTWNGAYDIPRVRNQMDIRGVNHDGMLAWHVLNSAIDKRLGFVTPFYVKNARMWKHLSSAQPAFYNAQDAAMAWENYMGIRADLDRSGQGHVFQRHVIDLSKVLDRMSATGVARDEVMRSAAEAQMTEILQGIEAKIDVAVPVEARRLKIYKKAPKVTEGLVQVDGTTTVKGCTTCDALGLTAAHFKTIGKKRLKAGDPENLCVDGKSRKVVVPTRLWAKQLDWKPSNVGLKAYQASLKQSAIRTREGGATFDDDALKKLIIRYPKDPLYPLLGDHRTVQKLRGTYVGITQLDGTIKGGLRVGRDGFVHVEYTNNPNTLRLACQNPNAQNLPRPGDDTDMGRLATIIRNLVVARPGYLLFERDYSAIEAVLSAYAARWKDGIRLAKLGVHSYLASFVLKRHVDLKWSDADLKAAFKEIKGSEDPTIQRIYNACKRTIHLSNYGGTPRKMVQAEPETFRTEKFARELQETYFAVAEPIRKWQLQTQLDAHTNGFLRNPFDYVLRFSHVFRHVKEGGKWVRKPGDQANEALAFWPQSTAAGIIKEAMLRLAQIEEMLDAMRWQIHDSLLNEAVCDRIDVLDAILKREMERPIEQLPLPDSWGMGPFLIIETDAKRGERWGSMRKR